MRTAGSRSGVAGALPACLVLLGATLAAYSQVPGFDFIYLDDAAYVTKNPLVAQGISWRSVTEAFTEPRAGFWIPLTWISYMIEVSLGGVRPSLMHTTNLLLHSANALLLFLLLRRLTGKQGASLMVALLFALHPVHVESVAWVTERKDVLSGFFLLLAVLAYAAYCAHRTPGRYLLVAFWGLCSLLAKPVTVTLPLLLLALDYWPLGRLRDRARIALLEKVPLLALSVLASVLTFMLHQRKNAVTSLDQPETWTKAENFLWFFAHYLGKVFWPVGLTVNEVNPSHVYSPLHALAGLAVLLLVTLLAVRRRATHPWLLAGWAWFVVALLPTTVFQPVGNTLVADRFTYIPMIGVYGALVWWVGNATRPLPRWVPLLGASATVAVLVPATWSQTRFWKSDAALNERILEINPGNDFALARKAVDFVNAGKLDAAESLLKSALRTNPNNIEGRHRLGLVFLGQGRHTQALIELQIAAALAPDRVDVHHGIGVAYLNLGNVSAARAAFERELALNPGHAAARRALDDLRARAARP